VPNTLVASSKPPSSGVYAGRTSESDGIVQGVRTKLGSENGHIDGWGNGLEDGRFKVSGEWKRNSVRWEETYNLFSVIQYIPLQISCFVIGRSCLTSISLRVATVPLGERKYEYLVP
jgi:hypothetical protein